MNKLQRAISFLVGMYFVIQIAGIIFIALGFIDGRAYLLGWITGSTAAIVISLILILAYLGEEGKRIVEAILSKIL
ncbi:MAG: hypothetical protein QXL14_00695 [Candidatus Aenigmatarchaeota archaeon]